MWELIKSGGWLMLPIVIASMLAVAIVLERAWALRSSRVAPQDLLARVWQWIRNNELNADKLKQLRANSPLGEILAAGLLNSKHGRDIMKESIEESASHVIHDMEKNLGLLGTIAVISPLLGLLGTVVGIIEAFMAVTSSGLNDPTMLAGGISKALITTAGGIVVAIPAMVMHRWFQRHIQDITVEMEQQAIKLVDIVHGDREVDFQERVTAEKPVAKKPAKASSKGTAA
ncbi:MAG: MotA/TolQ/ExbB proton channel family protein [Moraxellaceae bacterium]|nr:MotA/TolQ/ExbB proton channel family protein [Moraxellaceae bacterium]MBP8852004.1 MotA/TolQ/ExbB proton channel family protein [Moraxellaceae bacterium]MBP9046281.1 MotA/TolQ/ExbB proton channel family protein [Moraxellaceae bacterium]MBP9731135.1 MotA/TolQ/ExbB proton channel family protein [Moraxellaceae bacterium]HQV41301.1 MotA/TolQ/ExbB proton channel family protein [Moraxellaceae bacterium]